MIRKKKYTHNFKTQNEVGLIGEEAFKSYYSSLSPEKSENQEYDFKLLNGDTVEVKTDTYLMDTTPNFFMEYISNTNNMKLGGPWRAFQDSVDLFVYYYLEDRTFFWFRTIPLHAALEDYLARYNPVPKIVRNRNGKKDKGYDTQGFAVPRDILSHLVIKKDVF